MNRDFFLKQEWVWPVLICAAILLGIFLWKEYRQKTRKWLIIRIILCLVAVLSLVLLILQPIDEVEIEKGIGVILTQNYNSNQRDSLAAASENITIINYFENGLDFKQLDSITRAYILGDGLETYDFWQLDNISTSYMPGKRSSGIHRLKYDHEIYIGDPLNIKGLYSKPKIGAKIILQDPSGTRLDSIILRKKEDTTFTIKTSSKVAGLYEYSLLVTDSLNQMISSDIIPVIVEPQSDLRILILNTFPSFETKYLKNFLAKNGHEVLVRSQISKNKYKFENYNRPQGAIYNLTMDNLSKFDLVIMDGNSYVGLARSSQRALNSRIEEYGLGLFIQPDAQVLSRGDEFGFRLKRNNKNSTQLSQWPKIAISVAPYIFEQNKEVLPILTSEDGMVSAYYQKGFGRISTSLALETYPLILKGHSNMYEYIWSQILGAISQRSIPIALWESIGNPTYIDEPLNFKLKTFIDKPKVFDPSKTRVSLRQDLYLPEQWQGVVYPSENGWHRLQLEQDSTEVLQYYVYPKNNWQGLRQYTKRKANENYFKNNKTVVHTKLVSQPYTRLWFFVIFLIAIGLLWFIPKL